MISSNNNKKQKLALHEESFTELEKSILQLRVITTYPENQSTTVQTESGVVISHHDKKYILTTAHIIENNTIIHIDLKHHKYKASVVASSFLRASAGSSTGCNLALLKVQDDSFNAFVKPLKLDDRDTLPEHEQVKLVGFNDYQKTQICISDGSVRNTAMRDIPVSIMANDAEDMDENMELEIPDLSMLMTEIISSNSSGPPPSIVLSKDGCIAGIIFLYHPYADMNFMIPQQTIYQFTQEAFRRLDEENNHIDVDTESCRSNLQTHSFFSPDSEDETDIDRNPKSDYSPGSDLTY